MFTVTCASFKTAHVKATRQGTIMKLMDISTHSYSRFKCFVFKKNDLLFAILTTLVFKDSSGFQDSKVCSALEDICGGIMAALLRT